MAKDKDKSAEFMMRFELGLEEPLPNRATNSAITIGVSYIVGGIILYPHTCLSITRKLRFIILALSHLLYLLYIGLFQK